MGKKQIDWDAMGKQLARDTWDNSGQTLKGVPPDPHGGGEDMAPDAWSAFRGGYRRMLHVLNLHAEARTRPAVVRAALDLESLGAMRSALRVAGLEGPLVREANHFAKAGNS